MYTRWKRTKRKGRKRKERGDTLTAVLVKSERVNGQPRQKYVATLASIREGLIGDPWHHYHFWNDAEARLDMLELDPAKVEEIKNKLSQRVAYIPQDKRREMTEYIRKVI